MMQFRFETPDGCVHEVIGSIIPSNMLAGILMCLEENQGPRSASASGGGRGVRQCVRMPPSRFCGEKKGTFFLFALRGIKARSSVHLYMSSRWLWVECCVPGMTGCKAPRGPFAQTVSGE